MNLNISFLIKAISKKKDNIIWSNNRYYNNKEFLDRITFWRNKIKKAKIKSGSVIAFESEFNFNSISFFISTIIEKLIVIPIPKNQKDLLNLLPCQYFVNIQTVKITKKKVIIKNDLLKKFQSKNKSGLIIFSSGSSGKPKIILHDLLLIIKKFEIPRPGFKTLLMLTFDHLGGINTLLASLIYDDGVAICLLNRKPQIVCKTIMQTSAQLLPTTPTFLNILLISRYFQKYNLNSLKLISYGAEKMPEELLKKLKKQFNNVKFKQTYGLSEFGVMRTKTKDDNSLSMKIGGEGFKVKIINNTLYVKSISNMIGYLNAKQPFDKNGWINTGDKVKVEKNGYITILGRKSDIINIGGEKVFPQEIENILLKNKYVNEARVKKMNHDLLGEYIIAEVTLNILNYDKEKILNNLRKFCLNNMTKYKVPSKFNILSKEKKLISNRLKKKR
jgi:long-chain acyl-CoA synthetase